MPWLEHSAAVMSKINVAVERIRPHFALDVHHFVIGGPRNTIQRKVLAHDPFAMLATAEAMQRWWSKIYTRKGKEASKQELWGSDGHHRYPVERHCYVQQHISCCGKRKKK
jgi:hypothetical protein